ncbi:hypothetical protein KY348_06130 [Candidatus Woesearchaeota archaeon]|nr:hypothetical protein [Candidatus Woesearchaeota archaeon]
MTLEIKNDLTVKLRGRDVRVWIEKPENRDLQPYGYYMSRFHESMHFDKSGTLISGWGGHSTFVKKIKKGGELNDYEKIMKDIMIKAAGHPDCLRNNQIYCFAGSIINITRSNNTITDFVIEYIELGQTGFNTDLTVGGRGYYRK